MEKLVDQVNLATYNRLYDGDGMDHLYPNENFVRLERWYFGGVPGRALDHGFGSGENLIHLLHRGYQVEGLEVAQGAMRLVEQKLQARVPHWRSLTRLTLLDPAAERLPYPDNTFDYVVSLGVVEWFPSRGAIVQILNELCRVMKPGGKMILSTVGAENSFCKQGTRIAEDVYTYTGLEGHDRKEATWRVYIFRDEAHLREVLTMFQIDEVGWFDNHYCNVFGFHFVVLARK